MEEIQKNKGCLIDSHKCRKIIGICIDVKCQSDSRPLCSQCLTDRIHQNCDCFLQFEDFDSNKLNVDFSKFSKLHDMIDYLVTTEEEECQQIDQFFDNLLVKVSENVNELRKTHKVKLLERRQRQKLMNYDIINRLKQINNLDQIQKDLDEFQINKLSNKQLNDSLKKKQQQTFSVEEEKLFFGQYSWLTEKSMPKIILQKDLDLLQSDLVNQIQKKNIYKKREDNNENQIPDTTDAYINLIPLPQTEYYCFQEQNQIYISNGDRVMSLRTEQKIPKNTKIKFRYKIKTSPVFYGNQSPFSFNIGIISINELKLLQGGMQLEENTNDLIENNKILMIQQEDKKYFETSPDQNQTIYTFSILIKDNKIELFDHSDTLKESFENKFAREVEEWVLFLELRGDSRFTFEVL